MKKIAIFLFLGLFIVRCDTTSNDNATKNWIEENKKPIVCTKKSINAWSANYRYSLMSADNKFFTTGEISFLLPDTIKLEAQ